MNFSKDTSLLVIIVITANNLRWRIETFIWDTLNTHFVPSYSSSYYSLIYLHNSMSSPIFENQRVIAVFLEHQRVSQMPLNFKNLNLNKIPRLSRAPCICVGKVCSSFCFCVFVNFKGSYGRLKISSPFFLDTLQFVYLTNAGTFVAEIKILFEDFNYKLVKAS